MSTPEPTWAGCAFPEDVLYDVDHDVWLRPEGDEVRIGMIDLAQTRCGRIVSVGWKEPGRRLRRGRPLCVVESAKWVGPVLSPIDGVLVACNRTEFDRDSAIANRYPYGEGWLVLVRPDQPLRPGAGLLEPAAALAHYRRIIDAEGIRCFRCAE
jgi:glycine cleavage system H protein